MPDSAMGNQCVVYTSWLCKISIHKTSVWGVRDMTSACTCITNTYEMHDVNKTRSKVFMS